MEIRDAMGRLTDEQKLASGVTFFKGGEQYAVVVGALVQSYKDPKRSGEAQWLPTYDALAANCGTAIELLLKAFLVSQGTEFGAISKYGHKLCCLLGDSRSRGLGLSQETQQTIITIGSQHHIAGSAVHEWLENLGNGSNNIGTRSRVGIWSANRSR